MRKLFLFCITWCALVTSAQADMLTTFMAGGSDAASTTVTWTHLGGVVTVAATVVGNPAVDAVRNALSELDANGSVKLHVSALANTGGAFNPASWSGGVAANIHTTANGWGVTGDSNGNTQSGEGLVLEFDFSQLGLGAGDFLVWTAADFAVVAGATADVWKQTGVNSGERVSAANSGLASNITISDGDVFAIVQNRGTVRLRSMTLDVVPDTSWHSSLVYHDQKDRLTYRSDADGCHIVDFSHAGYHSGEAAIPNLPVVHTISPIAGDDTRHIQDAIDYVATFPQDANGHRGAILLTAGTYEVKDIIFLNANGIVLRGEGQGDDPVTDTILVATGTRQLMELGTILVQPKDRYEYNNRGIPTDPQQHLMDIEEPGTRQNVTRAYIPAGSRCLDVEEGSVFAVGDYLVIEHLATTKWIRALNGGNIYGDESLWLPGDRSLDMTFHGTITAIDGNRIKLDTPIYHPLDRSLAQAEVYRHSGAGIVRECGVENLRIVSENIGGTNESHRRDCVHFIGARNCWAKNSTGIGFVESGFRFSYSTRCSAMDCSALKPVSQNTGGRRYNFYIGEDAHDILVKNGLTTEGRHSYVGNGGAGANGIVFTQCESRRTLSSSENHRRWGSAFLWDNINWNDPNCGTVLAIYNRGNSGTAHGWTGTGFVAWNCNASGKTIVCSEPPIGQNYAVGCRANMTHGGYPFGGVEGTGETMAIPSLYEAQLAERLAHGVGPDAPTDFKVTHYKNTGSCFVALDWVDLALEEDGYVVERSANGGLTYSVLDHFPADTESFTDTTVAANGTYVYRVTATNTVGRSAYSNPVSVDLSLEELPESVVYQAEDYSGQNGCSVRYDRHDYTADGYVDMGTQSTWFELEVDGGMGGEFPVIFRFAADGSAIRPCKIIVDGVEVAQATFTSTGSWDVWDTETVMVPLSYGINTLRLQPSGGAYGPNLDEIEVAAVPAGYAAGEWEPSQTAEMAFDLNVNTVWRHNSPYGSWVQYAYRAPLEVAEYMLTSGDDGDANDPTDWKISGSVDGGASWTVLDERSGELFASRGQTRIFSVANSGEYQIYRLDIERVRDLSTADSVQLAEFQLVPNLPPVDPNPAAFAVAPYPVSETSISMTSEAGTSAFGIVKYYFAETSGNDGGTDSGWISSPVYTDTGLIPGLAYRYTVKMRDAVDNEGTPSAAFLATTYKLKTIIWSPAGGRDGLWTSGANWSLGAVPLTVEQYLKVTFAGGAAECRLDVPAVVSQFVMGSNGTSVDNALRLEAGADLTCGLKLDGTTTWTALGYNQPGTLTVEAGATLTCEGHLWVGYNASSIGTLTIEGGTVNANGQLGLGWNGGKGFVNLRSGTLTLDRMDVAKSISAASVIDIQSGTLVVNGDLRDEINAYVSAGRITAYSGASTVTVGYNSGNDQTSVSAVPFGFDQWKTEWGTDVGPADNDHDGDGRNNFYEYVFNGNPTIEQ